jgi:hypothetical protein
MKKHGRLLYYTIRRMANLVGIILLLAVILFATRVFFNS